MKATPRKISKDEAIALVREEATKALGGPVDRAWAEKVEWLSRLCGEGVSKTHIAFLGTVMIAKAMHRQADLFAIKPEHAKDNPTPFRHESFAKKCWCRLRPNWDSASV